MMKPKIAIFHNLPSGGAKRVLFENIKGLNDYYDFYLYDLKGSYDEFLNIRPLVKDCFTFEFKEISLLPRPFGFLNSFCRMIDLYRLNKLHKKIAQAIDKKNYSLVFIFADRFTQTPFILKHLKTKTLYYCHDPYIRNIYEPEIGRKVIRKTWNLKETLKRIVYYPGEWLHKKILAWQDKKNTKKATKIIICSRYAAEKMAEKYGVLPEVVYPGVDTRFFRPLNIQKDYAVISQGSILYRKGHHFIIEVLSKIEENIRPRLFILADSGRGDEEKIIIDLANKLGVKIEFFKGIKNQEEVVKIYNKAILCLCGQIAEPFGLAVLEAGACGLPVVSVDDGGMRETVINGKNGYLVKRDPKIFTLKIKELLKDKEKREKMGKWAREYVIKNYDWQVCNQRLKEVIDKIINSKPQISRLRRGSPLVANSK